MRIAKMQKNVKAKEEKVSIGEVCTIERLSEIAAELAQVHKNGVVSNDKVDWSLLSDIDAESELLKKIYSKLLNNINSEKMPMNEAEEWLLDNFYIVKDQIKEIRLELPRKYNRTLPKLKTGEEKGHPRIYSMAVRLVQYTDAKIEKQNIISFINGYQTINYLNVGEVWAFPLTIRIALVRYIYSIATELLEHQEERKQADKDFTSISQDKEKRNVSEIIKSIRGKSATYLSRFIYKIREKGEEDSDIIEALENMLQSIGMSIDKIIYEENQQLSINNLCIGNAIVSIKMLGTLNWEEIFEKLCIVEKLLREDPVKIYSDMDFQSRDRYRHSVEELSRRSKLSEEEVAKELLHSAQLAAISNDDERIRHVGYHLIGKGRRDFEKTIGYKPGSGERVNRFIKKNSTFFYTTLILVLTSLIVLGLVYYASKNYGVIGGKDTFVLVVLGLLAAVPASEIVITGINYVLTRTLKPNVIPRMDFKEGIPDEHKTIIVIPCLLSNPNTILELVQNLEVHYLSNPDHNLHFALLGDYLDSKEEVSEHDSEYLDLAIKGINELNKKYARKDLFFFFNRKRLWNEKEKVWMGWERKRGKLLEFNKLIRGDSSTSFNTVIGDTGTLKKVKYVITLDADTKLQRDSAIKLIGAMAHPLNKAVLNSERTRVIDGYGILQPRVAITVKSANHSYFALAFSGQTGIDPYTTAVSDVYQDLFNEGIYTGKGIYDLDIFDIVLSSAIPENSVLSHDLLEGSYARTALVSDIELIDSYPSKYNSYCARLYRWVRGDWQLIPWLFPQVRKYDGKKTKNPLNFLSKWKIIDNLRRSFLSPGMLLFLLCAFTIFPGQLFFWVSFIGVTIAFPIIAYLADAIITRPNGVTLKGKWINVLYDTSTLIIQVFLSFAFLPYQAYLMSMAIIKTVWRLLITHKNMLEWESAASAESRLRGDLKGFIQDMWISPIVALLFTVILAYADPAVLIISLPFLAVWAFAPYIAFQISTVNEDKNEKLTRDEKELIRMLARKTWRYYDEFINKEDNYLAPDNYQFEPHNGIAHRTSPTNIGLGLLSNVVARDLGYIGIKKVVERIENIISSIDKLQKWKGHLYNWYDTLTMEPLKPLYVSTVDSGNLIVYLITLKQALISFLDSPLVELMFINGLRDTVRLSEREGYDQTNFIKAIDKIISNTENGNVDLSEWKKLIFIEQYNEDGTWAQILSEDIKAHKEEWNSLLFWWDAWIEVSEKFNREYFKKISIRSLIKYFNDILNKKEMLSENQESIFKTALENINGIYNKIISINNSIDELIHNADFTSLYDEDKQLFAIGYLIGKERLDLSSYDLLASECRQTSFIAIAKGEIPEKHWFRLSRAMTSVGESRALLSWTGTMFEYLMPPLIMKVHKNTLLYETYMSIIKRQIEYGKQRAVPWGISEAGFYSMDLNYNYQYKAFGVPGLGYKRGLNTDLVISPYSTMLALPFYPKEAISNIKKLISDGAEGEYGLYEAIDYTPQRIKRRGEVVKSFMVHHLGMSFLAIDNFINSNIMQERFHSEPMVKASELLLEERVPKKSILTTQREEEVDCTYVKQLEDEPIRRKFSVGNTIVPEAHFLSNGRYNLMVTNTGSGYSSFDGKAVSRWREDPTKDNWGTYIYIQNLNSMEVWSATYAPFNKTTERYEVVFFPDRAVYSRTDGNIDTRTEVFISNENNVEVRRISLTNHSEYYRVIELTSYFEPVLAHISSDIAHPAFSNLFIQTEYVNDIDSLIAWRRPRSESENPIWLMHTVTGETIGNIQFETNRLNFIGRKRDISDPIAMEVNNPLGNTAGTVLDPCISLRVRVKLLPGETKQVAFSTGVGVSKEEVLNLARLYKDFAVIERTYQMAWAHSKVEMDYLDIDSGQSNIMQKLLSSIIYLNPLKRNNKGQITKNIKGQTGLWSYGISGDMPIVLLRIKSTKGISVIKQLLNAHAYWRLKGIDIDLVILNEDSSSYNQYLRDTIGNMITLSKSSGIRGNTGKIILLQASTMTEEDKDLLIAAARLVLEADLGNISSQLQNEPEEYDERELIAVPLKNENKAEIADLREIEEYESKVLEFEKYKGESTIQSKLNFFNGYGGFDQATGEYVITLDDGKNTPMPWSNVISNERFGFLVTESGGGYTWNGNSRENKLTEWSNDPVIDPPSEIVYLRDEVSRDIWTITAGPIRDKNDYIIRHGQGYSVFHHVRDKIKCEQTIFVPNVDPVKIVKLKLQNTSDREANISAAFYSELVMGVLHSSNSQHISSWVDEESNVLCFRNGYNEDFSGKIAFLHSDLKIESMTCDRTEFIGRNGNLKLPEALKYKRFSGRIGAGFDSCAAIQVVTAIEPKEEKEIIFLFGQGDNIEEVRRIVAEYSNVNRVKESLKDVKEFWQDKLNVIQVNTPDLSMNFMLNKWLLYQTLSCRIWGRTAFYQAGGAYGFRDQLQDVMAFIYSYPELVKNQIILHCNHQFIEGDVQHWWHQEKEKGIRTRFSDDLLWLPYVTSEYIKITGDWSVLEEEAGYIEGEHLKDGEDEKYSIPWKSKQVGTVYEHCIKAIERGMKFGEHGIPLMGSGDWNDGMNRVGNKGKGESVWVGWFLIEILKRFLPICEYKDDKERAKKYKRVSEEIAEAIEEKAWDGGWYRRAYFDNGKPLGSTQNEECQIDSISQSWGVISGAARESRMLDSMKALENYLVNRSNGMIYLLTPAFDKSELDPGYIKGYVPGVRENGGQYTHAAIWALIAFARLKLGDKALELYHMINPINHSETQKEAAIYKVEPYVMAADVYSNGNYLGKGGWSWYTGAACWMYKAGLEEILGFKLNNDLLTIDPCISRQWKEYTIIYKYKNTKYEIIVHNTNEVTNGIEVIYVDRKPIDGKDIKLIDDGDYHVVDVVMGNEERIKMSNRKLG